MRLNVHVAWKMFLRLMECMKPVFKPGTHERELLDSRQIVMKLVAVNAETDDPFIAELRNQDESLNVVDTSLNSTSYWNITTHSHSPKESTYRRFHLCDRSEPLFAADELKVKVLFFAYLKDKSLSTFEAWEAGCWY